jgi:hypothetical protein
MTYITRACISAGVAAFAALVALYGIVEARTFGMASMWFPTFASAVTFIAAVVVLWREILVLRREPQATPTSSAILESDDDEDSTLGGFLYWMLWFVGLFAALVILGGFLGTAGWLCLFLIVASKQSIMFSTVGTAATVAAIWGLHALFGFAVPPPIVWPF